MKKILLSLLAIISVGLISDAQQKGQKILVAYVSMTGNTEKVAQVIANVTGGELYEIEPEKRYSTADIDWRNDKSRCYTEMHDLTFRPAIKTRKEDIANYDIVYLGFPIWWNIAPTLVNTFIESHNLEGKMVIPFATSGGSAIDNSVKELKKAYPKIGWTDGKLLNHATESTIRQWVNTINK